MLPNRFQASPPEVGIYGVPSCKSTGSVTCPACDGTEDNKDSSPLTKYARSATKPGNSSALLATVAGSLLKRTEATYLLNFSHSAPDKISTPTSTAV